MNLLCGATSPASQRIGVGATIPWSSDTVDPRNAAAAAWYEEAGQLSAQGLDEAAGVDVTDFHASVNGPVCVLAVVSSRSQLETLVGSWRSVGRWRPRTIERLRELLGT